MKVSCASPVHVASSAEYQVKQPEKPVPFHVGIIPDGNRRYARKVGISVEEGYLEGTEKALEGLAWCLDRGIRHLSAFGVSQENITRRPMDEVRWLHRAVLRFCRVVRDLPDVRLHIFGEPSELPSFVPEREELTRLQDEDDRAPARLVVHAGVNYSARAEMSTLVRAARKHGLRALEASPAEFALSAGVPPVDLVVRTGGQQRLSGFLPIQTAYAELWFTPTLWPELQHEEFVGALAWYARQERRFGE